MKRENGKKYSPAVYEEACDWFVEFRTDTPEESSRRAFCSWLQEGPAHMAAYLDVAADWNRLGTLDVRARFPKELLICEAGGDTDNVLSHPRTRNVPPPKPPGRISTRPSLSPVQALIVCSATILVGVVVLFAWINADPAFSTGIGQERVVTLADGSVVDLNARSEIRVHYTKTERSIELARGEALFTDTRDPLRPFLVKTHGALVRAIGTEFDVNRRSTTTIITVVAGQVAVADTDSGISAGAAQPPPAPPGTLPVLHTVYVTAGEQLTIEPSIPSKPVPVNVSNAVAWTRRELVFASTPLRDVVEEFNRYNARQLVITDPSLQKFQIDGVFSSANPTALIDFLRQYPGIRVVETSQETLISRQ
jgi:transmembrane sensor